MSYYEKIKELIDDDDDDALRLWMQEQPLTEQLAIAQTVKDVVAETWGDDDSVEKKIILSRLDNVMEEYVDKNLDAYNATVAYEKAVAERDKTFAELEKRIEGIRGYLIECVTTNASNAAAMKELALQVIEMEKVHGTYDPQNWEGIV